MKPDNFNFLNTKDTKDKGKFQNYLNDNLWLKVTDFLDCGELEKCLFILPVVCLATLDKRKRHGMCHCQLCCLDYRIDLTDRAKKSGLVNQLAKLCANKARIRYIRGLHYRFHQPYHITTNYLGLD